MYPVFASQFKKQNVPFQSEVFCSPVMFTFSPTGIYLDTDMNCMLSHIYVAPNDTKFHMFQAFRCDVSPSVVFYDLPSSDSLYLRFIHIQVHESGSLISQLQDACPGTASEVTNPDLSFFLLKDIVTLGVWFFFFFQHFCFWNTWARIHLRVSAQEEIY